MNNLDKQYQNLLQEIIDKGVKKQDRTGTGTISVFGRQIRHNMKEGFPLLTTKKMYFNGVVAELLWFLRGDTDIRYLWENKCNIWDGDWYKNYTKNCSEPYSLKEMKKFGLADDKSFHVSTWDLGPIYGKQWRNWAKFNEKVYTKQVREVPEGGRFAQTRNVNWVGGSEVFYIDQITNLINNLKTNPDSRRLMVNAWNVGELDQMVLPPCHYGFQVYTRELNWEERYTIFSKHVDGILTENWADEIGFPTRAISLMWNQRSVDTFLGLPFNIASYGLLLEIIAKAVNMVPDELIGNLGDTHLYLNHIDQAKEQIGRELTCDERIELASTDIHFDPFDFGVGIKASDESIHRVCDLYGVPRKSRQPYELPKLIHMKTDEFYKSLSESMSLITHLDVQDFKIENYKSHPSIKAPLSN